MTLKYVNQSVQGVDLSKNDKETLKLYITKIRRAIEPDCNNLVGVDFIPLLQWGRFQKGKWVVRIKVQQGEQNRMYAYKPNEQDRFMFSSAFREDGLIHRYELSEFLLEYKQVILNGRQKSEKIYYAEPHDESNRCEADYVQDLYDRFRGSFEKNEQTTNQLFQQSFVHNGQNQQVEDYRNNQNFQQQILQMEKQIMDLNCELQRKEKENQDQAQEIMEIKNNFEKERKSMAEQFEKQQVMQLNKSNEGNRNTINLVQQQQPDQFSLQQQSQINKEQSQYSKQSDKLSQQCVVKTPMQDQQADFIKKENKSEIQMIENQSNIISDQSQVNMNSQNNQIKQDQFPLKKAVLPGKMWGNIYEFNPIVKKEPIEEPFQEQEQEIQKQEQEIQMQEQEIQMQEKEAIVHVKETPGEGEEQKLERGNRRDRNNLKQKEFKDEFYQENEQERQLEQQYQYNQYQQQVQMYQQQMELYQQQKGFSQNECDNDTEQYGNKQQHKFIKNEPRNQEANNNSYEKVPADKQKLDAKLAKVPGNDKEITKETLDQHQYWMIIVSFYEHEAGQFFKELMQKYPEQKQNIKFCGSRKLVSVFFSQKNSLQNTFNFCQESQIPYFKIIVKGIELTNKDKFNKDDKTVIYFNTTKEQLKDPRQGITQPIVYLNNIKAEEKIKEIVQRLFKCEKIIFPKQKDKSKMIVSTRQEIIDAIDDKQYNLIRKDNKTNEVGFIIDSNIQFKDIRNQNGLINQINELLSDTLVFGKFEFLFNLDDLQISFENSTEALIAYITLKESLSNDWFKIDRQVNLTSVYPIPLD